ncbi:glycosyltransferase family 87 protein [Kitasatospora paranensis]|uniref:Glycosyltransferase 87 family protein n=1 Tax=Kitasatospora paranensis TaxID=258053 RepID=A0ABW2FVR6_9ACTN
MMSSHSSLGLEPPGGLDTAAPATPATGSGGLPERLGGMPVRLLAPAGYWACSRVLMIGLLFAMKVNVEGEMHTLYEKWSRILATGSYPLGDPTWQYPPGAALVMLAPKAVPAGNYVQGFVVVAFLADLVVMLCLLLSARTGERSTAGVWVWVLGLPLMLYMPYARYDVIVTAFAVTALLVVGRRPGWGGALASFGAMIKVWPAFAVFGAPRGRTLKSAVAGFVAAAVALTAILCLVFTGPFDFLGAQQSRGVEFESLAGSVLLVGSRFAGYTGRIQYHYGSMEFLGPYVPELAHGMVALTVLGFCWLLLWRWRASVWSAATPADAALAAVLVFTTTSRVISPQYFIWLVGLGAVCLVHRSTTQRPVVALLAAATALTTVEYPLFFEELMRGSAALTAVLVARNLLLLAATVLSCRRLWQATVVPRR